MGITFEIFRWSGKLPWWKDRLIMCARNGKIISEYCLIALVNTFPCPGDVPLSAFTVSQTSIDAVGRRCKDNVTCAGR